MCAKYDCNDGAKIIFTSEILENFIGRSAKKMTKQKSSFGSPVYCRPVELR